MRRFFVEHPIKEEQVALKGKEHKHLSRVLRIKKGDSVILFDGSGKDFIGKVIKITENSSIIRIEKIAESNTESPLDLTLIMGIIKGKTMEEIIRHVTELGVRSILPIFTERSIPKWGKEEQEKRVKKWQIIAKEATKQCGRTKPPEIFTILSFSKAISIKEDGIHLIFWEEETKGLKKILESVKYDNMISIAIGPEGGFSKEEIEDAKKRGWIPVSLGKRILRAETAAITAAALIQHIFGDLG